MDPRDSWLKKRLNSFKYAFKGFSLLIKEEPNFRIHLAAATLALLLGALLGLSHTEWLIVVFAIGWVLALEAINASIERLADFASPGRHETIKKIKDISAAAVLVSASTALIAGLIIFIPKI